MTNYLALARKWRPQTFAALQGHTLVTQALTNALQSQRLHHAYLFTGTRGVGKTSIARLFAKALNCERGISSDPCLTCSTCEAIEQGRLIDLIEIDAASKTRVEDTREMLDNVQYGASTARFKIYLIDEVHMLSLHSFNALLKTLEEPPSHVKFLLATTDPQKIPVTVLSRCLQFHLHPLSLEQIIQQLEKIIKAEHIQAESEALALIAKAAKGSMRDALSLLDQTLATAGNEPISLSLIKTMLGYTQKNYAIPLLEAVLQHDPERIITLIQHIVFEGGQFIHVNENILTTLHTLAIAQQLPNSAARKKLTPELTPLAEMISPEEIHLFYQIALKGGQDMLLAPLLSLGFEMSMMRMLSFRPAVGQGRAAQKQISQKPESLSDNTHAADEHHASVTAPSPPSEKTFALPVEDMPPEFPLSLPTRPNTPDTQDWPALVASLNLSGMALSAMNNAEFLKKEDGQLTLRIQKSHSSLFTPNVKARIEEALRQHFQEKLNLILQEETHIQHSIAQKQEESQQKAIQHAAQSLAQDRFLQDLQSAFSAEMMKESIRLLEDEL